MSSTSLVSDCCGTRYTAVPQQSDRVLVNDKCEAPRPVQLLKGSARAVARARTLLIKALCQGLRQPYQSPAGGPYWMGTRPTRIKGVKCGCVPSRVDTSGTLFLARNQPRTSATASPFFAFARKALVGFSQHPSGVK